MSDELVAEGTVAPDFTLPNADEDEVTLSAYRGQWVVLFFYPEDNTMGCTMEARAFRTYFEAISIHQAAIIGVSRDDAGSHCSFRDRLSLPFELLSDEDEAVHDLYGAWRLTLFKNRVVRRCTYLIDPEGVVRKVYPKVNPLNHAQEVVADLARLVSGQRPADLPAIG